MLEKERAEKAATQTKQPKSTPAASANDEE
jgi:hypothetical protein